MCFSSKPPPPPKPPLPPPPPEPAAETVRNPRASGQRGSGATAMRRRKGKKSLTIPLGTNVNY